jgi:hypothetical protein
MASVYEVFPLGRGHRDIRLVTILRADEEPNPVYCTITKASLGDNPQYTALFYVWGNPVDPITIYVNGAPRQVTQNLGLALKSIRKVWGEITLWVDAIPINQDNLDEKADQIPMMGQIYRTAEKVICWLGEDAETVEKFGKSLAILDEANLAEDVEEDDTSDELGPDDLLRGVLLELGFAEYWKRTWIVQEVVLARIPLLQAYFRTALLDKYKLYDTIVSDSENINPVMAMGGFLKGNIDRKPFFLMVIPMDLRNTWN